MLASLPALWRLWRDSFGGPSGRLSQVVEVNEMRRTWTMYALVVCLLAVVGCKEAVPVPAEGTKGVVEAPADQGESKAASGDVEKAKVVVDAEPVVLDEKKDDAAAPEAVIANDSENGKAAVAEASQEEKVAVAVVKQGETVAIAEAPAVGELKGTEGFAAAVRKNTQEEEAAGALVPPAGLGMGAEAKVEERKITVAFGSPRGFSGGELDREKLAAVLAAGPEQLSACFVDEKLESDHHANLNYVVKVEVGGDGKAVATVAEDYMGEAAAGACAVEIIGGWEFSAPEGGAGSFLITMVVRRS